MTRGWPIHRSTAPLAAVTPGTPGGLMEMLARYGTLSLAEVLAPAIEMAEQGYPIEAGAVRSIARFRAEIEQWPESAAVFLPNGEVPEVGDLFVQRDLAETLKKLVAAEAEALAAGAARGGCDHGGLRPLLSR